MEKFFLENQRQIKPDECFLIIGGNRLNGEVEIDCAKNSLLPIIASTILIKGEVELKKVPLYNDVLVMCEIIRHLGGKADFNGEDLIIDCSQLDKNCLPNELASQVRSSVFTLGPILGRMKSAKVAYPGGCDIGLRPIDLHLKGIRELGAKVVEKNGYIYASGEKLKSSDIMLSFPSVGATENIMMLAVAIDGETRILNPAREPEINDLQDFLNACGGDVSGAGSNTIVIRGGKQLHGISFTAMPDRIETGTFIIASVMCGGNVTIKHCNPEHCNALLSKLSKTTCKFTIKDDIIKVESNGRPMSFGEVETAVYPGFPTDLQAPMTALASVSDGYSLVVENLFEARSKHVGELLKMGSDIKTRNGITIINGKDKLYGADVFSPDLRGGASLVLAGLVAEGYTTIENIKLIDRGYYKLEEKLTRLGGDIKRMEISKRGC